MPHLLPGSSSDQQQQQQPPPPPPPGHVQHTGGIAVVHQHQLVNGPAPLPTINIPRIIDEAADTRQLGHTNNLVPGVSWGTGTAAAPIEIMEDGNTSKQFQLHPPPPPQGNPMMNPGSALNTTGVGAPPQSMVPPNSTIVMHRNTSTSSVGSYNPYNHPQLQMYNQYMHTSLKTPPIMSGHQNNPLLMRRSSSAGSSNNNNNTYGAVDFNHSMNSTSLSQQNSPITNQQQQQQASNYTVPTKNRVPIVMKHTNIPPPAITAVNNQVPSVGNNNNNNNNNQIKVEPTSTAVPPTAESSASRSASVSSCHSKNSSNTLNHPTAVDHTNIITSKDHPIASSAVVEAKGTKTQAPAAINVSKPTQVEANNEEVPKFVPVPVAVNNEKPTKSEESSLSKVDDSTKKSASSSLSQQNSKVSLMSSEGQGEPVKIVKSSNQGKKNSSPSSLVANVTLGESGSLSDQTVERVVKDILSILMVCGGPVTRKQLMNAGLPSIRHLRNTATNKQREEKVQQILEILVCVGMLNVVDNNTSGKASAQSDNNTPGKAPAERQYVFLKGIPRDDVVELSTIMPSLQETKQDIIDCEERVKILKTELRAGMTTASTHKQKTRPAKEILRGLLMSYPKIASDAVYSAALRNCCVDRAEVERERLALRGEQQKHNKKRPRSDAIPSSYISNDPKLVKVKADTIMLSNNS